ncbi:MAG: response regulator [Thermodesulfobacteriota bacterium]
MAPEIHILLVDDDPLIRSLGRELLEHLGYRVETAQDGQEALQFYRGNRRFDLVILDHNLPGQSGLEVLQKLKDLDPQARVLVASGDFSTQLVRRLQEGGVTGFIHKPFRVWELETLIKTVLTGVSAG